MRTKRQPYEELLNGNLDDDQKIKVEEELWRRHTGEPERPERDGRTLSCYELQGGIK